MSVLHPGDVTNQVALRVLFLYRGGRRAGRGFDFLLRVIGSDLTQHSIYLDLVFIQQRGDGFPNRHTIVSALVGIGKWISLPAASVLRTLHHPLSWVISIRE